MSEDAHFPSEDEETEADAKKYFEDRKQKRLDDKIREAVAAGKLVTVTMSLDLAERMTFKANDHPVDDSLQQIANLSRTIQALRIKLAETESRLEALQQFWRSSEEQILRQMKDTATEGVEWAWKYARQYADFRSPIHSMTREFVLGVAKEHIAALDPKNLRKKEESHGGDCDDNVRPG